jgi:hypothetical protein
MVRRGWDGMDEGEGLKGDFKNLIRKKIIEITRQIDEDTPEYISEGFSEIQRKFANTMRRREFTTDIGFGILKELEKLNKEIENLPPVVAESRRKKNIPPKPKRKIVKKMVRR